MDTNNNELLGKNLTDLISTPEDAQGFSSTDSATAEQILNPEQVPPKKANGNEPIKPVKPLDGVTDGVEPSTGKPVKVEAGILSNIRNTVDKKVQSAQNPLMNFNLEDYAPYMGNNPGLIGPKGREDHTRAVNQSATEQFGHAVGQIGVNILPEIASQVANIFDIEDYNNSDAEIGNTIQRWSDSVKEWSDEAMPIYETEPGKALNVGDSAWWFKNGSSLVTSAGAFVATGYMAGALTSFATLRGARALKMATTLGQDASLSAQTTNALGKINSLGTALMLNQSESLGIGVETYNESYKKNLEILKAEDVDGEMTPDMIEDKAKEIASKDAASAISFNRWNILLNITSANLFLKTPASTRNLLKKNTRVESARQVLGEGLQEYAEENINDISKGQALDRDYGFKQAMEYVLSEQGLEAGLLGFAGGAGQTALTKAGKYIPMYKNTEYYDAYRSALATAPRNLGEAEKDAYAREKASEVSFSTNDRVSDKQRFNSRYAKQQEVLDGYESNANIDNINDVAKNLANAEFMLNLTNELESIKGLNEFEKERTLERLALSQTAQNAFTSGTTESLIGLYEGYLSLTNEQAEERGLYKKGDENTEDYFKTKAKSIIADIEYLENQYNKSKEFVNSNEVYNLNEIKYNVEKDIKRQTENVEAYFNTAEMLFAENPELHPGKDGRYRDTTTKTGFNLAAVNPKFRATAVYEKLKDTHEALSRLKRLNVSTIGKIQKITTSKYQEELKKKINAVRQAQKRAQEKEEAEERAEVKKADNRSTVAKLKDALSRKKEAKVDNTISDDETVVTPAPVPVEVKEDEVEDTTNVPPAPPKPPTAPKPPVPPVNEEEEVNPRTNGLPANREGATHTNAIFDVNWSGIEFFNQELKDNMEKKKNDISNALRNPSLSIENKIMGLTQIRDFLSKNKESLIAEYETDEEAITKAPFRIHDVIKQLKEEKNNVLSSNDALIQQQRAFIESLESEGEVSQEVESSEAAKTRPDYSKSMQKMQALADTLANMVQQGYEESDFVGIVKSFEAATDKARMIILFPKFKALYNAVNQSGVTIEGTYEEVMYGEQELEETLERVEGIAKFHKVTETYTSDLDTKTQEFINMYEVLAQFNGLTAVDTGIGFEIYNEKASDKLAYLVKDYLEAFSYKYTKETKNSKAKKYVAVTKSDINNVINAIDQRILSPSILTKGKSIKFIPLDQVVLENGNIRHLDGNTYNANSELVEEGDGAGTAPIGIMVDGTILDKVFLHDTTWLNGTNLDATPASIEQDREKLKAFKQRVIDEGSIESEVTYRSGGVPILDNSGIKGTVAERTPNVTVGIARNGKIEVGENVKMSPKNAQFFKEGKSVIVIPHAGEGDPQSQYLALPVNNAKLYPEYIESIISATRAHLKGELTEDVEEIENKTELNLININSLTTYINSFISLRGVGETNTKVKDFKGFVNAISGYQDNANLVQVTGSQIFYGRGGAINTNAIGKSKYKGLPNATELIEQDLAHFREFLKNVYTHINTSNLGKDVKIPILEDGKITKIHTNYSNFVKENLMSQYLSINLDSGEEVYTIQSIVNFDMEGQATNNQEEVVEPVAEVPRIENNLDEDFNFDDITDFSHSLAIIRDEDGTSDMDNMSFESSFSARQDVFTDEFVKELKGSYSFIDGMSIGDVQAIVKTIANTYYKELLTSNKDDSKVAPLKVQVDKLLSKVASVAVKMQAQLDIPLNPNLLIPNFVKTAEHIIKQSQLMEENKAVLLDEVKKVISRKKNTKAVEDDGDLDTEKREDNEDTQDEESTNTKSVLFNVSEYTVDPKSGLSDAVRYMLESVREYTIVEKKDEFGKVVDTVAKPKMNVLKLHSYMAVNNTFETLKSILSKSNDNFGYVAESDINFNENYKENTPDYIKYIITRLRAHVKGKPYLLDVIDILKESTPEVQNQFATNFNGHATNHIFLMSEYNKKEKKREIRRTVAASRNTNTLIISEWQNNLYYKNLIKTHEGKRVLSLSAVRNFAELYRAIAEGQIELNYENINRVLSEIGVSIPLDLYKSLLFDKYRKGGQEYNLSQMFELRGGLFRNIYDRVVAFRTDKKDFLDLEVNNLFENSAFRDLSYLVSKYRKDLTTNSFRNTNGDMIYGFSNSRFAPDRTLRLKSDKDLIKGLNNDPFSANSIWLKGLTNKNEDGTITVNTDSRIYQYLKYYTSDGLKIKGMDALTRGKTIDNLVPRELERYHFGLFMNDGMFVDKANDPTPIMNIVYPTMEEKSNTFVLQVPSKYFKLTSSGSTSDSTLEFLVDNLFAPELNRILAFQEGNRPNVLEMEKGGNFSILFPKLHAPIKLGTVETNTTVELFDELGKLDKNVLTGALQREALKSLAREYIEDMYKKKEVEWENYGILERDNNGELNLKFVSGNYKEMVDNASTTRAQFKLKEIISNYIINTSVAHMNIQQLFIGDPALFSDMKFKPSATASQAENALNFAISTSANQVKRLTGHNGSKQEFNSELGDTMGVLIIKDAKVVSTARDYIKSLLKDDRADGYNSINASDAQELTTLKEHLRRMTTEGKIKGEEANRILEHYNLTGKVQTSDLNFIIQPYKPVYFNNFEKDGKMINFYIKSSSYPLISSFTKGKPLDALRELMENEDNGIDTTAFESAVKLGKPINVPNIFNVNEKGITDGTITIPDNWRDGHVIVPRQGHGNQQENPYDPNKKEVNDGTQQAKLAFTNLLEVEGFIDPETKKPVKGRELAKSYLKLYEEMYIRKYTKLVKDLGYDSKTGKIANFAKLSKMLKNEGLGRNYSYNDVKGFALNGTGTDFEVPLWAGNSAVKVEALLSSIVDNKVRKRKVRGKSLILASAAGVDSMQSVGTIEDVDVSDVVKVGDWDGVLKAGYEGVDENGNKVMVSAEVLIPFKYWDNNGKPLELNDFLKEDGTLDMTKLPAELLEIFSYRIPTSGVNLMSNIKVVGFLPQQYGDMVIAPPDFVEQMGSDFDVDKLYTHMYSTTYDFSTGKLEKISDKNAEGIKVQQDARRSDIATIEGNIAKLEEKIATMEDGTPLKKREEEKLTNWQESLEVEKASDILSLGDIRDVIIQNKILDIHRAILNNPAVEVQSARVDTLSFGSLPELADKISKGKNREFFTPISQSQQAEFYTSARAGKAAVGVFSLNMIFNSVAQFVEGPMYFRELVGKEYIKYRVNIAGVNSNNINDIYISGTKEFKSKHIEAFMTSALDNGKEQLLGKLNINNTTFDFIRAAIQMGFSQDIVISILNQPSIIEYVKNKENRIEQDEPLHFSDEYRAMIEMTSLSQFQSNFNSLDSESELQKAVLSLFESISAKGRILKTAQSAINSDSSGIGKNLFYNAKKIQQIIDLPKTGLVGAGALIGSYVTMTELEATIKEGSSDVAEYAKQVEARVKEYEDSGYIRYEDTLIKPNSLGGFAAVYATLTNGKMWQKFFPYQNDKIMETLNSVLDSKARRATSVNEGANESSNMFKHFKSFLISDTFNLFSDYTTVSQARTDLMYSTPEHMDLGSIIFDLRQSKKYTNLLLDGFEIGDKNSTIDTSGATPNTLSYFNAGVVEDNEEVLGAIIVDMLVNPKDLGEYNGEMLTTRDLMNKIITHQMINGGIQKGAQIIKFIPYTYLKQLGYYDSLSRNLNMASTVSVSQYRRRFKEQYLQHFPSEFYKQSISDKFTPRLEDNKIKLTEKEVATLPYIILSPVPEQYDIYKYDSDIREYRQIDNLGNKGDTEFDMNAVQATSSMHFNQANSLQNDVEKIRQEVNTEKEERESNEVPPTEVKRTPKPPTKEYSNKPNTKVQVFNGFWTRDIVENNPDKVFLFGDNTRDRLVTKYVPSKTQAVIRGLDNAIGIDTKKDRGTNETSYFTDDDFDVFKSQVDETIAEAKSRGKVIVLPSDGIGTGAAELNKRAPKLYNYLVQQLNTIGERIDIETPAPANIRQDKLKTLFTRSTEEGVVKGSVVKYKDKQWIVWNVTDKGKAQLISSDGTKFSGTPNVENVSPVGYYTTTVFNGTDYVVTSKEKIYSLATGSLVYENKDNSTKMQKERIINQIMEENGLSEVKIDDNDESNNALDSSSSSAVVSSESIPTIAETPNFLKVDRNRTDDTSTTVHPANKQRMIDQFFLEEDNLSVEDKNRLILDEIARNSNDPILSHFANVLKDVVYLLNDTPIKVDYSITSRGVAHSNVFTGEAMGIFINPNLIESTEEMRQVLMEEIVHGITKKTINDYKDGISGNNSPMAVIDRIRKEVVESIKAEVGQEKWDRTMAKIDKGLPLTQGIEADLIYSSHNIEEFLAAAIKNTVFKTYLNNKRTSDATLNRWQRFLSAIKDILVALGVRSFSNLEAVLDNTLRVFDGIKKDKIQGINRPKYYRNAEYLNKKFNLVDSSSSPIVKGNPQQIADYINTHIVNVRATAENGKVKLSPLVAVNIASDMSSAIDYEDDGIDYSDVEGDEKLRNAEFYVMTINDRIRKLESNMNEARNNKDFARVEELDLRIAQESEKREDVYQIASVVALADEARKDFDIVESILERDMNIEDVRYVKYIVNFWKNGMEYVFDPEHYTSTPLTSLYGQIEGMAKALDLRLSKIEKENSIAFIKKHTNATVDLDEIFRRYQDIGWAKADWRSVSTVDNALIVSNWAAIQNANIDARAEVERLLGDWDKELENVVPILKRLNNKNLFAPFIQYTERGKNTNHIIKPYTDDFYKDKYSKINSIYKDKTAVSMNEYMEWARNTGEEINLNVLLPSNNKETAESIAAKEAFKAKIGVTKYNYWEKEQKKALEEYNSRREAKLESILAEHGIKNSSELGSVPDAEIKYRNWTTRNSPYILSSNINKGLTFKPNVYAFNSQRYFVPVPASNDYLDARFKTIESNPTLLTFYDKMVNVLNELESFVPQEQKRSIAYGGLPSVEKSLVETFSEKGSQVGFAPIMESLIRSTQTSYTSDAKSELDVSTGKDKRDLRIPLIKNPHDEVQDYRKFKQVEYIAKHGKNPSPEMLKEFEEDAVDEIASRNSLDLGKVIKMYTSLVIGLKHKAKIEDHIHNNNTILDSYQEVKRRPDGEAQQLGSSGEDALMDAKDSYVKTKQMNDHYINNVMYGDARDEQGKGKKVMTPTEKAREKDLLRFKEQLEKRKENDTILEEEYETSMNLIETQLEKLGKTLIYSKVADQVMKGIQLKVMGWNFLGGISNLGFGWIANQIEAAGGKSITKKQLATGYRVAMLHKSEDGRKADSMMKAMDVLQEASYELQTSTTRGEAGKKVKPLEPFMITKITEGINQKPLMVALAMNFKVTTNQGEMPLWQAYDKNGKWRDELGERPDAEIKRYQLKLISLIGRIHGNYDALSPMAGKRTIFGRAASQFRGWMPEAIASRFEDYRMDVVQDEEMKGRYRSVGTMFSNTSKKDFATNLMKGVLRQWSFGKVYKDHDFSNLVDGVNVREIDATNMRKVSMELVIAINLNLFLLAIASMFAGDDDEPGEAYNILFNQGTRMRTDLMLYVNPMEARNLIKDLIPAMSLVKDVTDWNVAVYRALKGEDEIESGINAGDSRVLNATLKNFPLTAKFQSIKSAASQVFDNSGN